MDAPVGTPSENGVDAPPLLLYADDHIVAVNKPPGLLVHRSNIDRHETRFALQRVRDVCARRVYPVHRLDKPTSGVLLFAFSSEAARHLAGQFEANTVRKRYLAVVRGWCAPRGEIDHPLADLPDAPAVGGDRAVREARTAYVRLATVELPLAVDRYPTSRYSLVRLQPRTGRRHQLRRHLKHLSHPVIGDTTYGKGPHNRLFRERYACERLLLACTGLTFRHPATGNPMTVTASAGEAFHRLGDAFGWCVDDPAGPEGG